MKVSVSVPEPPSWGGAWDILLLLKKRGIASSKNKIDLSAICSLATVFQPKEMCLGRDKLAKDKKNLILPLIVYFSLLHCFTVFYTSANRPPRLQDKHLSLMASKDGCIVAQLVPVLPCSKMAPASFHSQKTWPLGSLVSLSCPQVWVCVWMAVCPVSLCCPVQVISHPPPDDCWR